MSKGQTSYPSKPSVGIAGERASTMNEEVVSASNLCVKAFEVAVAALQNTTLYRVTVSYPSRVPATAGQTLTANADYTSDGSATQVEILAGLKAAVDALDASIQVSAQLVDTVNGPLLLKGDSADMDFTLAASANLTVTAETALIPFGVFVCKDGTSDKCRLPAVAADIANLLGFAKRTLGQENHADGSVGYSAGSQVKVAKRGEYWSTPEEAVNDGDPVYTRYATSGANTQKGALRKSPDGVAQVIDITPTAVNAADYIVSVGQYTYHYTGDGSATAAEIIGGLLAKINLQTALHGVTASDATTTLKLTGLAGVAFDYSVGSNLSAAVTTAGTQTVGLVPGAKFKTTTSNANDLAKLSVNMP